jgi:hypothetical protein
MSQTRKLTDSEFVEVITVVSKGIFFQLPRGSRSILHRNLCLDAMMSNQLRSIQSTYTH